VADRAPEGLVQAARPGWQPERSGCA